MKQLGLIFAFIVISMTHSAQGQIQNFSEQDSLRGSITPERAWWDLKAYRLHLKPNAAKKEVKGMNRVVFESLTPGQTMQIDLQEPMQITKITHDSKELNYSRNGNVFLIEFAQAFEKGSRDSIDIYFEGRPKISSRPPWDGGLTWTVDSHGKDFFATSVQGEGASIFWPCKDHMYDEVDNMDIYLETDLDLVGVSNGRLVNQETKENSIVWHWQVLNPINNYGVNMNVGNYVNFYETYKGLKGDLFCNYYVLEENEERAVKQFTQVSKMMEAFEYWFGPYPFYEDSFKLVEVPYLGMEHQSSVTYGNGYQNGYLGSDLSGTGWGLKFDFIIIHEAGHEWFANNITNIDIADMWIHESFTAYSESLFVEYYYGKQAGQEYVIGTRRNIQNDRPIIGNYDVNHSGSGDMYYKGSNMLNTLRTWINNDELWRDILVGLNSDFYHQTVNTGQIEKYIADKSGLDLKVFFDQYLRTIEIPTLELKVKHNKIHYRYCTSLKGFNLPIQLELNESLQTIHPTQKWQVLEMESDIVEYQVNPNYYINLVVK